MLITLKLVNPTFRDLVSHVESGLDVIQVPEAGLFRRYEKLHARLIPPAAADGAVVAAASDAATAAAGSLEYVQNI